MRLCRYTPSTNVFLSFLGTVHQFEFVEVCPGVTQIGFDFHGAVEPIPALLRFAFAPEQFGDGEKDMGVVFAPLQGVHALGFPLRSWLQENRFRP